MASERIERKLIAALLIVIAAAGGYFFYASRSAPIASKAPAWLDESEGYGEDRYSVIGTSEGRLLYVAYTMRGEAIRIISARLAEPQDRRRYHEENDT